MDHLGIASLECIVFWPLWFVYFHVAVWAYVLHVCESLKFEGGVSAGIKVSV